MTALVKLYPTAYRQEFGDEIAGAYREATRGAALPTRVREAVDVAGHALRMRLGLGSATRAGRLLAALAPFAAVTVGATALSWARLMGRATVTAVVTADVGPAFALPVAAQLVTLLGAFLALAGRWAVGSRLALVGAAAAVALTWAGGGALFTVPLLLLALVMVLCPPDLRPVPRIRTRAGVVAVMAWTAVVTSALVALPLPAPLGGLSFAVPVAAGLLLAGRPAFARLRTAPSVLLAGLPLLFFGAAPGGLDVIWLAGLLVLLPVTAAVVGVRGRRHRPAGRTAGG
ncbi:hypothetical protein ACFXB3_08360 [Streptomyces sp. NPDC059447]|uniref:hypothetical protein n=1 Tax=Streptomyces sp. NPDC059447 TaxID=3346834 RepID=UPI0036AD88B7